MEIAFYPKGITGPDASLFVVEDSPKVDGIDQVLWSRYLEKGPVEVGSIELMSTSGTLLVSPIFLMEHADRFLIAL